MTQAHEQPRTRAPSASERVFGYQQAIDTHHQVGNEFREAIRRIGGTPPENLPPAEPIQQVKKRLKGAKPKLELEDKEAKGLGG